VENSATVVVVLAEGRVHVHGRRRRAAAARSRRRSPLGRRRAICQFGQTCVGSAVSRNCRQLSVVFNRRYRLYNTHTHTHVERAVVGNGSPHRQNFLRAHRPIRESQTRSQRSHAHCHTIRYVTRCYVNVRSKADMSQLNLPLRTGN